MTTEHSRCRTCTWPRRPSSVSHRQPGRYACALLSFGASWKEHLEAAGISATDVDVLLDAIALVAEPVRISYLWRPCLPDPDDDLVLESALNGQADVIVTFNQRDFAPAAKRFGLEILAAGEAVRRLETLR